MSAKRILIVDDDVHLLEAVGETLRREGYEIVAAENWREAEASAREFRFNLFLLDFKMPDVDGIELMKCLRAITPSAETIIITGHPTIEKSVEAMRHGARDYMCKPMDIPELLHKVNTVIEYQQNRAKLEEQLRQSEKMQAIGQLAGGIAHNLNNQLTPILGYADMLARKVEDEKLREYAEHIITGVMLSADSIRQLLAFARKGVLNTVVPFNMHKTIAEVVELLKQSIDKRIHIRQLLEADPSMINGDPSQLQSVIFNLALNAIAAMPNGGDLAFSTDVVALDEAFCKLTPFTPASGRFLKITVTDTGVGMTEEIQKRIFEPFFTTKGVGEGTGMGLASVYGSVDRHNGTITVETKPDEGSTFTLYLPSVEAVEKEGTTTIMKSSSVTGTARILMVDDEEGVRKMTTDMLGHLGYEVTTAKDGKEAVEYYKDSWRSIDLVLLDMMMPEMNGRDTFIAMRGINPNIKSILCSGYDLSPEV